MYDRDFNTAIIRSHTAFGTASSFSLSVLRKEFGANNFYGGNAPSREWTNQTLLDGHHHGTAGVWNVGVDGSYRTHGDRFVFNQVTPALSDNRHRTHAVRGTWQNPMTRAEVGEKCMDLMAPVLGSARARRLCETIWNIGRVRDARALRPLLAG